MKETLKRAPRGESANKIKVGTNEEQIRCSHCESENYKKNGSYKQIQRYRCKDCKRTFSDIPPKHSFQTKLKAVKMYLRGSGLRAVAESFGISHVSLIGWIKSIKKIMKIKQKKLVKTASKAKEPDIIELDEIYTYCKKNCIGSSFGLLTLETKSVLLVL